MIAQFLKFVSKEPEELLDIQVIGFVVFEIFNTYDKHERGLNKITKSNRN